MKIIHTASEFREAERAAERPLGLVPTMGYLHAGHMSLVRRARADNRTVAVSVFVNPAQFGANEDLSSYPRDLEGDLEKLRREGADLVFAPSAAEMYPPGFSASVDAGAIAERLEGASRPGHFRGVATVVCKLLAIARPDNAYFGQKDAQQLLVIRRVNDDLNLGANIVAMPTVRDPDGLALSSRNARLSADARQSALALPRALRLAESLYADGARDANAMRALMAATLNAAPGVAMEYVSVADARTLAELDVIDSDRPALASLAARVGGVRLIDNALLGEGGL